MDIFKISAVTPAMKTQNTPRNTQKQKQAHKDKKEKSFAEILKEAMK